MAISDPERVGRGGVEVWAIQSSPSTSDDMTTDLRPRTDSAYNQSTLFP